MTRKELLDLEVKFTDEWYKEHTGVPTYADAIEWTMNNTTKGASLVKWQTGEPKENGSYIVTYRLKYEDCIEDCTTVLFFISGIWTDGDYREIILNEIIAWCKLSDVEPYKE